MTELRTRLREAVRKLGGPEVAGKAFGITTGSLRKYLMPSGPEPRLLLVRAMELEHRERWRKKRGQEETA